MRSVRSIDEYLRRFPSSSRRKLQQIRRMIHATAPAAEEAISYGIPTFKLRGTLVHFAGYEHHIGFYPGSHAIAKFKKRLLRYKSSKGAIQLPIDRPLPLSLLREIVQFRVAASDPFAELAAPARRALERAGLTSLKRLSKADERAVAGLHGMGPKAMKVLRAIMRAKGLRLK